MAWIASAAIAYAVAGGLSLFVVSYLAAVALPGLQAREGVLAAQIVVWAALAGGALMVTARPIVGPLSKPPAHVLAIVLVGIALAVAVVFVVVVEAQRAAGYLDPERIGPAFSVPALLLASALALLGQYVGPRSARNSWRVVTVIVASAAVALASAGLVNAVAPLGAAGPRAILVAAAAYSVIAGGWSALKG